MKRYKVKLCGTTSIESAKMAIDANADYIGVLVNVGMSERSLNVDQAKAIVEFSKIPVMTLLYNMSVDEICHIYDKIKPYGVHLLGNTPIENIGKLKNKLDCQIWLTVYLPAEDQGKVDIEQMKELIKSYESAGADAIVIDTVSKGRYGGTGKTANWDIAKDLVMSVCVPVFLAGGINPENVREAILKVDPYGVDLASGVEIEKGKRDPEKVKKLMAEIRKVEYEVNHTLVIMSESYEETRNIGKVIGKMAFAGSVIALCGELGSGKTTLTQGIAEGLDVHSFVTSPTFVIVNQYKGRLPLYHIDTYRLRSLDDMYELGYEEFFYGDGVTVIEWAQKVEPLLPEEYLRVELEYVSESERKITIKPYGQRYVDIVNQIK